VPEIAIRADVTVFATESWKPAGEQAGRRAKALQAADGGIEPVTLLAQ